MVRKLQSEELNYLYCSPIIFQVLKSRRIRWAGNVVRIGKRKVIYRVLVVKPEKKRQLGRPRIRWENIKMDLQEVGCANIEWIELVLDWNMWRTLVNVVMNLRVQ
jgi:hypothetical protein